jgi:XTP/dITP diphosphohydrolase
VRVVLASANPDKAAEIRAIVGDAIELVPRPAHVPDVVEDGETPRRQRTAQGSCIE